MTDQPTAIQELDAKLEPVLRAMEERGVTLDTDYLAKLAKKLRGEIAECEQKIYREAGHEFTINSPRQLAAVLYDELHLAGDEVFIRKNKTGRSTAAGQLAKLVDTHPIIELILEYREKTKLLSTYLEPLPKLVDEAGKLHTNYRIDTAAGRLSSRDPNLQNIPTRTDLGKEIRRAFVASKGMEFLVVDYSQIELRIAAHLSGDPNLIKAFRDGEDIHAATGKQMGVDRRVAKAINFGVLFGQGAFGLSEALRIPREEAQAFIDQYYLSFPKLREWIAEVQEKARQSGYAETLMGRRRYLGAELKGGNAHLRAFAERVAINHPIQGTEAEIMSMAMVKLHEQDERETTMILQVHDELVFEVPSGKATTVAPKIRQIMESVIELAVPILTEAKHGPNWRDLEPIK